MPAVFACVLWDFLFRTAKATTNFGVVAWGEPSSGGAWSEVSAKLGSNVKAIVSTFGAFAALKTDGKVVTWGDPLQGGDSTHVADQLSNIVAIFSTSNRFVWLTKGSGAFAALKTDGVVTWGTGKCGGDSSAVASNLRSNVKTVFSTSCAFAALKTGGEVVTWGDNGHGGDSSRVTHQLSRDVTTIYSNIVAFAALKINGEVVTWGDPLRGGDSSAVASQIRRNVTTIFSNAVSFAALKLNGDVVIWGDGKKKHSKGLPAEGDKSAGKDVSAGQDVSTVASQLRNVRTICSSAYGFAVLKTGGEVVISGMAGDYSKVAQKLSSNVTAIYSNSGAFAALKTGGEVVTWGAESHGGDMNKVALEVRSNVTSIFSTDSQKCGAFAALKTNGEVVTWGPAYCGGDSSAVASQLRSNVVNVFSNTRAFAALKRDGKVETWGDRYEGGNQETMHRKLSSRVHSIVSTSKAFAALVCIPGKMETQSDCRPCNANEIWIRMECRECNGANEVPNPMQTACEFCDAGFAPNLNRSACSGCKGNTFAIAKSWRCYPCPEGHIANHKKSKCSTCPSGKFAAYEKDESVCKTISCYLFHKANQIQTGHTGDTACEINTTAVIVATMSIVLAMALLCPLYMRWRKARRRRHVEQALSIARNCEVLSKSFKSIHTLDFPMVLLRADTFLDMQALTAHETARTQNLLIFLDGVAEICKFKLRHKIIFFSHQWLSFSEPDPSSIHYNCMVQALLSTTERHGWSLSDVYVWVDYTSIPQACSYTQKGAISSLPIYASWSSAFVIVAPNAPHEDLGCECNLLTYSKRTWCRVECVSHYCHRGVKDMLVASSSGCEQVTEDWLHDVLFIFDADCTCCRLKHKDNPVCDKELLVIPALAMYMKVLLEKDHSKSSRHVYDVIQTSRDRMFPKNMSAKFMPSSSKEVAASALRGSIIGIAKETFFTHMMHLSKGPDTVETDECSEEERELFGTLLDDLQTDLPNIEKRYRKMQLRNQSTVIDREHKFTL